MTNMPGADTRSQWFADNYSSSLMKPNVLCLHTTEGATWPGYNGGSTAPNNTLMPVASNKSLAIRQHYPLERSSRALRNEWGGVETNTLNVVQWELVGTCVKGGPGIYWPDAPEWCYRELGKAIAQLRQLFPAIPLVAPSLWLAYGPDSRRPGVSPASYGNSPARMSFAEWRNFKGICGHQHIPENVHGDPGNLPIDKILDYAGREEDDMFTDDDRKILQKLDAVTRHRTILDPKTGTRRVAMILDERDGYYINKVSERNAIDYDRLADVILSKMPDGATFDKQVVVEGMKEFYAEALKEAQSDE